MATEPTLRKIEDLTAQLGELGETVRGLGHRVAEAHKERAILWFQAEWHIRGALCHSRKLFEHHGHFVIVPVDRQCPGVVEALLTIRREAGYRF